MSQVTYELILRDDYDRKDEHEKLVRKLVSIMLPSWVPASPAKRCIITYFSKGFFNVAVVDDCEKYNYFKLGSGISA